MSVVRQADFYDKLSQVRAAAGDRAALHTMHVTFADVVDSIVDAINTRKHYTVVSSTRTAIIGKSPLAPFMKLLLHYGAVRDSGFD